MRPSCVLSRLALAFVATSLAAADCLGGSNKRPDHSLDVIEFFYSAGCELQSQEVAKGGEFKKTGKSRDGKCMNVLVKNHGDNNAKVTSNQAVDAWAREWVGCEHGGKREYEDKLEYIWHLDC
ncbi:hypothetical protein B0H66DRAFT_590964 [Apodospora peruviana]|uniref:Uncharacterized protein n=1 Tax=Apodospora peruviana TaxID=516989 RepID=A0AAE0M4B7_9PEZI|nr:hypothetical protein B0H66DRAFT_590964 [Apodospora peruviana]